MPQLRRDPLVDRWVIIAPERAERPSATLRPSRDEDAADSCPFCPGHEASTPPELLARRAGGSPNSPGWTVRVVPNRYPALRVETPLERRAHGLYGWMAGVGAHEVIVETPSHDQSLADLSVDGVASVLRAWQERMVDLSRDVRLRAAIVFENRGAAAGATLSHAHSQLVALPLVPPELSAELAGARAHFDRTERCLFCDVRDDELSAKERLVFENEGAVAFAPYAARAPFETWILPRGHRSAFESASGQELLALADALRTVLRKIDVALERPAWHLLLHTLPLREPERSDYHFRLEVKPVLAHVAGFEWASGCFINPVAPEEAAAFLRRTEVHP